MLVFMNFDLVFCQAAGLLIAPSWKEICHCFYIMYFFLVIFLAAASRGRYWKMLSEISETWECFYDLKGFCLNEPFIVEFGVLALDFFVQVWIFMLHALIALLEKCAYL